MVLAKTWVSKPVTGTSKACCTGCGEAAKNRLFHVSCTTKFFIYISFALQTKVIQDAVQMSSAYLAKALIFLSGPVVTVLLHTSHVVLPEGN